MTNLRPSCARPVMLQSRPSGSMHPTVSSAPTSAGGLVPSPIAPTPRLVTLSLTMAHPPTTSSDTPSASYSRLPSASTDEPSSTYHEPSARWNGISRTHPLIGKGPRLSPTVIIRLCLMTRIRARGNGAVGGPGAGIRSKQA